MKFVDRVMQLNDVCRLKKFCLTCCKINDRSHVNEWISAAILRDTKELDLGFSGYNPNLLLPPSIFTSKTLVILRLRNLGRICFNVPAMVYLPTLKILHFHSEVLFDDHMNNLIHGCPIIEKLDIRVVVYPKLNTLFVQSSSLKSLRVHNVHIGSTDIRLRIVVDAANLERLDLKDDVVVQYDMINLSSLVEVKIDFCGYCSRRVEMNIYGNKLVELLRKLSNAKYLFLSCEMMQYLKFAPWDELPLFHNVAHLELKTFDYSWPVLPALLECFPNLITFVFHREGSHRGDMQFQAPKCSMLYLEEIKLKGIKGCT